MRKIGTCASNWPSSTLKSQVFMLAKVAKRTGVECSLQVALEMDLERSLLDVIRSMVHKEKNAPALSFRH